MSCCPNNPHRSQHLNSEPNIVHPAASQTGDAPGGSVMAQAVTVRLHISSLGGSGLSQRMARPHALALPINTRGFESTTGAKSLFLLPESCPVTLINAS